MAATASRGIPAEIPPNGGATMFDADPETVKDPATFIYAADATVVWSIEAVAVVPVSCPPTVIVTVPRTGRTLKQEICPGTESHPGPRSLAV